MEDHGQPSKTSLSSGSAGGHAGPECPPGALLRRKWILLTAWFVFLLPFAITRLPFFLKYPIVIFNNDDAGYFQIVDQINKGFAPHLSIRTIGYPLFLKSISFLSEKNFSVVAVQHALTLLCCGFFIFTLSQIYREHPFVPIAAALAMGAFATSGTHMINDSTIMTDSLFTNLVILALSLVIGGLFARRNRSLFLASVVMGYAILVRPAGLFFIPVFLAILAFALKNKFPLGSILHLSLPLATILFATALYNQFTIHSFSISAFTEHNLISYTSVLLEKQPGYAPAANQAITACQNALSRNSLGKLNGSWDHAVIRRVQRKHFEKNRVRIAGVFFNHEDAGTYDLYLKWRPEWRKMSLDAIRLHPRLAGKLFYSALLTNLFTRIRYDKDLYAVIRGAHAGSFSLKKRFRGFSDPLDSFNRRFNTADYAGTLSEEFLRFMLKEYYASRPFPNFIKSPAGKSRLKPSIWEKIYRPYHKYHGLLFRNMLWTLLFLVALIYSLFRLARSRFRHRGAFLGFILTFAALMYILLISLSAFPYQRYSCAMEFIYYLSPLLIILASMPAPEPERVAPARPVAICGGGGANHPVFQRVSAGTRYPAAPAIPLPRRRA